MKEDPKKLRRVARCLFVRIAGEQPTYIRQVPKDLRAIIGKGAIWRRLSDDLNQAHIQAARYVRDDSVMFKRLRSGQIKSLIEAEGGAKAVREAIGVLASDQALASLLAEAPDWRGDFLPADLSDADPDTIRQGIVEQRMAEQAVRRARVLTPLQELLEGTSASVPTVRELATEWLADTKPTKATLINYGIVLRHCYGIVGEQTPANQVTRAQARQYRDSLADKAPKTVTRYLAVPKAMYAWAIADGEKGITTNPFTGVKANVDVDSEAVARRPFSQTELKAVRNAIGGAWKDPDNVLAFELSAYLGLRLRECCGLSGADLRMDDDTGIMVIDVRPNKFRRLKTGDSERTLPIPPALVDRFEPMLGGNGATLLFPTLANAARLSRHFTVIIKATLGEEKAKGLVWHSLRHTSEDVLRETVPDAFRLYIHGRSEKGSAGGYGKGPRLRRLAEEVAKINPWSD